MNGEKEEQEPVGDNIISNWQRNITFLTVRFQILDLGFVMHGVDKNISNVIQCSTIHGSITWPNQIMGESGVQNRTVSNLMLLLLTVWYMFALN